MTDAVKPNNDFWAQAAQTYDDVTTSRPWRHTVGRISMLARIPIYLIGLAFQATKIVIKGVFSPIASLAAWALNTHKLDAWTFSGVAKDGLIWVKLLDKIGSSAIGVIAAPPKKYYSFFEAIKGSVEAVVLGKYHNIKGNDKKTPMRVDDFAKMIALSRPQYSKLFLEHITKLSLL